MPLLRRISAVVALAAFLGGGALAPAVHRAAHGIEHAQASHEAASQTEHVHADGIGLTVPLEGLAGSHGLCALCLPQHQRDQAAQAAAPRLSAERSLALQRPAAPAALVLALLPIRGPPVVA